MFKNVAAKYMVFAFDATTGLPKTGDGANITAYVSKDYGTVTVLADTSATEMDATNAKGYYLFDAAQAETNADCLMVSAKSSTSNIVVVGAPAVIYTRPTTGWLAPATAGRTLFVDASGLADANAVKVGPTGSGTAQTARDLGASVLLSSGTGTGQISLSSGAVLLQATQSGVTIPTVTTVTNQLTAAAIATGVWTDTTAGDFTTALSIGKSVMNGVTLGTGLTIAAVSGAVGSVTGAVGSVTGAVGSVTGNVGGSVASVVGLTASNLDTTVSSRGTSTLTQTQVSGGAYALNSASFSFNAALDFTTTQKAATLARVTLTDTATTVTNQLTSTVVAAAVWDLATSGHTTSGTFGAAMVAAGGAGDPWSTSLPGAYGAGTAGFIVGTNINGTITSRMATYSQPTGFLAATFPTTVASTTNITAASGVALSAAGLDSIAVTDPGAPASHTTLAKMLVAVWRALWKKDTLTATQWKRYADDGSTVNATSTVSDDNTTQTRGSFS